MNEIKVYKP